MRIRNGILALLVAFALPAIATPAHAQKKNKDLLSREEILKSAQADMDLHTAIKALRPRFFDAPRGVRSLGGTMGTAPLAVIVDKIRTSGVDHLLEMRATSIQEVRYLEPSKSENEFGITANGGALVITTFKGLLLTAADSARAKPPQE